MRPLVVILLALVACDSGMPGPPARLDLADGRLTGAVTQTVEAIVLVRDRNGNVVPGVRLVARPDGESGTIGPSEAVTDEAGLGRFAWQLGTRAGLQAIEVGVPGAGAGNDALVATFYAEVGPGPAVTGRFTLDQLVITGGTPVHLPFDVRDAWGNEVTDPRILTTLPYQPGDVRDGFWDAEFMGHIKFFLDIPEPDTLDVFVQPPPGDYRAEFLLDDTLWVETGRFDFESANPAAACVPPTGQVLAVAFTARGITRIRTAFDGSADTVTAHVHDAALVSVIEPGISTPPQQVRVDFRPLGFDRAGGCTRARFVKGWRFAIFDRFSDSLIIRP